MKATELESLNKQPQGHNPHLSFVCVGGNSNSRFLFPTTG